MSFWLRCEAYFSERPSYGPYWIFIQDGRIEDIRLALPESICSPVIDTKNTYLLPLLSDTHVHCHLNPWPLNPGQRTPPGTCVFEEQVQAGLERLQSALSIGAGLLRDMGDPRGVNLEIKKRILENSRPYPILQVAGPAIHRTGKYGRWLGTGCESLPDMLSLVDGLAQEKAVDFIKIISTGIVDFSRKAVPGEPQFSAVELSELVERARSHGLPVISHASGAEGIDINLEAGVSCIEHGYLIRPDQIERLRDTGIYWTPTFAPVHQQAVNPECGWKEKTRQAIFQLIDDHEKAVRSAQQQGARILGGTDAGSPGCDIRSALFTEIECLAHCMELTEVLRTVTAVNADSCAHPEYTGRIRTGDPASFALYTSAPWKNLSILGKPRQVYQNGLAVHPQKTPSHASN